MDFASLGLKVDATEVDKASQSLDRMATSGKNAENAATQFKTSFLAAGVAMGGALLAIKSSISAANEYQKALNGLASVAKYAGQDVQQTLNKATSLTTDGLLATTEAATSLKNLLARGFSTDQAVTMINRFKDSAAFGRQSSLEFGQAVVSATEGIKNENSVLVDNAGVTKNVSVMWKEYAAQIGKTADGLSLAEKRQAEYDGILRETEAQIGNAALAAQGYEGSVARMNKATNDAAVIMGQAFTPVATDMAKAVTWLAENAMKPLIFFIKSSGVAVGELVAKMSLLAEFLTGDMRNWGADGVKKFAAEWNNLTAIAEQSRISIIESLSLEAKAQTSSSTATRAAAEETAASAAKAAAAVIKSQKDAADSRKRFLALENEYWDEYYSKQEQDAADAADAKIALAVYESDQRFAIMEEDRKKSEEFWKSIENTAHDTFVSVANGGKDAATRLRDSFKNIFFDWLYQMTLKKWIINVSTSATLGMSGTASADGFGDVISGGYAAITDSIGAGFTQLAGTISGGLQGLGVDAGIAGSAGVAGAYIGAGAIGIGLGSYIAGNKNLAGLSGTDSAALGAGIGMAIAGPVGAVIGGALGGIANAAFGESDKRYGTTTLTGSFSGAGFSGANKTPWATDGGWFSSGHSGDQYDALTAAQSAGLNTALTATVGIFQKLSIASGESTRSLEGWNFSIEKNMALAGSEKDLLIELANSVGAQMIPRLAQFKAAGESLGDTAVRLTDETNLLNHFYGILDSTQKATIDSADYLAQALGGIANASAKMGDFVNSFASDATKTSLALSALVSAGLPAAALRTKEDWWKFMSTASPQQQAAVLANQGAILTWVGAMDTATGALQANIAALQAKVDSDRSALNAALQSNYNTAKTASGSAMSVLTKAIDTERKSLTDAYNTERNGLISAYNSSVTSVRSNIDAIKQSVSGLSSLASSLKSTLASMGIGLSRSQAQAQLAQALATARTTGVLPASDAIKPALDALSKPSEGLFSNFVDYQRDFMRTGNDIAALGGIADTQLSAAERQVQASEQLLKTMESGNSAALAALDQAHTDNISRLDGMLTTAQAQLDAINGTTVATLSIKDALAGFAGALSAQSAAQSALPAASATPSIDQLQGNVATSEGALSASTARTQAKAEALAIVQGIQNEVFTPAASRFGGAAGIAMSAIARAKWTIDHDQRLSEAVSRYEALPAFALGGQHFGGARLVGERGPEIEFTGPSRIMSNDDLMSRLRNPSANNEALVTEIKALREEVKGLRAEAKATAGHTAATSRLLNRAMPDGDALATRAAA